MKIKYWSASGSCSPPSLIPALRNIGILHHNKAELRILLQHSVFPLCMRSVKFIYSEKATKFCEIFTLHLSYVVPVKSKMKISQNFVAFSEYMNFIKNKAIEGQVSTINIITTLQIDLYMI